MFYWNTYFLFLTCVLFFKHGVVNGASHPPPLERSPYSSVFHVVEGFALVTLCSSRPATRRLAVSVLREIRALFALLEIPKVNFRYFIQLSNENTLKTILLSIFVPFLFLPCWYNLLFNKIFLRGSKLTCLPSIPFVTDRAKVYL